MGWGTHNTAQKLQSPFLGRGGSGEGLGHRRQHPPLAPHLQPSAVPGVLGWGASGAGGGVSPVVTSRAVAGGGLGAGVRAGVFRGRGAAARMPGRFFLQGKWGGRGWLPVSEVPGL